VATAASVAAVVAAAAATNPNLLPLALASVLAPACLARPQQRIQPVLVSGLGFVAPPASGRASGVLGHSSAVSGRGSSRGSGASGRGVSSRGSGASSHGVSSRGAALLAHGSALLACGSGVPGRGAVPTRAPGWRSTQVRTGKSPGPFS
jgi:hypothetical protein